MSQPPSISASRAAAPGLHQTISRAAAATGTDFDYLFAQAKIESALDPAARARTSSAAGLYQFTRGTWLATLEKHGERHGLGWASAAIEGGQVRDPALRDRILALRFDPAVSAMMAGELAGDNRDALAGALGREPDAAELYLAHFLGAGGATRLLAADPSASAAALLPDAAAANRAIFFDGAVPRSAGGVIALLRGKVAAVMGSGAAGPAADYAAPPAWAGGSPAALPAPPEAPAAPRASMADTLLASFGASPSAAPAHVRAAYGKLRSFAL